MKEKTILKKTPLYALHQQAQAKLVPFAGYEMPVQYPLGVLREHRHTREQAGLFDVSHMGQIRLTGPKVAQELESLIPIDIIDLPEGKQRYGLLTNDQGGILDDLMVSRFPSVGKQDDLYLVVNAACKTQDIHHIKQGLSADTTMEVLEDRALLALQGPYAVTALCRLVPEVRNMIFMDVKKVAISGIECYVSRSGYTGEDGFEISIPANEAASIAYSLLQQSEVEWIGLGARDSLRLESGLCLYGHDITQETTPVEAKLLWAISKVRRAGGAREGKFLGADIILKQIELKNIDKQRVGLVGSGRIPVREGIVLENKQEDVIGKVTSGTFAPSVEMPIAMAYVSTEYAALGTVVYARVRGKAIEMEVSKMPFITQRYYRG